MTKDKKAICIVEERFQDQAEIRAVYIAAFEGKEEADVVDKLRNTSPTFISLVAMMDEKVIGHILFTPVRLIQMVDWSIEGMGLAPLAVLPEFQNQGVGTALCSEGLKRVKSAGNPFVVVLGDPSYYARFGFEKASDYHIRSAFNGVPEDAFMIQILKPDEMAGAEGTVYYQQEFDSVT